MRNTPLAARVGLGLLVLALLAMVTNSIVGFGESADVFFVQYLYNIVLVASGISCLARAVAVRHERVAWLCLGAGVLAWACGNIYFTLYLIDFDVLPIPSWSDAGWLAFYPPAYIGLGLLLKSRLRNFRATLWLDGLVAGLAVSAVGAAVVLGVVLDSLGGGDGTAVAVALAYPMLDLLLLGMVVGGLAVIGWKPGRPVAILAAALAVFAVTNGIFVYQGTLGTYEAGSLMDMGWPTACVLIALAAWQPTGAPVSGRIGGWGMVVMPLLSAMLSLGVLLYDNVRDVSLSAVGLAAASLLVAVVRMGLTYGENVRMLERTRLEAETDALTGLPNRRKLVEDLQYQLGRHDSPPAVLALFDLNGFKLYNDSRGHLAGDMLLSRLGHKVARAVAGAGVAYRMGGDEFCVLVPCDPDDAPAILERYAAALSECGDDYAITPSYGVVSLPEEAVTDIDALALADGRMYAHKATSPHRRRTQDTASAIGA